MKVLILGNMGYVGPAVVDHLRRTWPDAVLHGFDNAYFAHCLTGVGDLPERRLDGQVYGDVRRINGEMMRGYDAVVQLAAISNDPMGDRFEAVTLQINQCSAVAVAKAAAAAGVRNFVFASSCSVYGLAGAEARREGDPLNPMTAYARSKIGVEQALAALDTDMVITCLRFATACGMSDRLRLDLVLNDFVASAVSKGEITVLSDGTPWRPLIDVKDMARCIEWAISRRADSGGPFLAVNAGCDEANYQVRSLAEAVAAAVPGVSVSVNTAAPADSRSYRVDFGLYRSLAPDHQPAISLEQSIDELIDGLKRMAFSDGAFRQSQLIRLNVLQTHIAEQRLTAELEWRVRP
jgi:UDP-glucose 4-epimerase